ncbi:hypothetical protein D3C85_1255820 [compost metagenome]
MRRGDAFDPLIDLRHPSGSLRRTLLAVAQCISLDAAGFRQRVGHGEVGEICLGFQSVQLSLLGQLEQPVIELDRTGVGDDRGVVHDLAGPVGARALLDLVQGLANRELVTVQARVLDGGDLAVAATGHHGQGETEADQFDRIEGSHVESS